MDDSLVTWVWIVQQILKPCRLLLQNGTLRGRFFMPWKDITVVCVCRWRDGVVNRPRNRLSLKWAARWELSLPRHGDVNQRESISSSYKSIVKFSLNALFYESERAHHVHMVRLEENRETHLARRSASIVVSPNKKTKTHQQDWIFLERETETHPKAVACSRESSSSPTVSSEYIASPNRRTEWWLSEEWLIRAARSRKLKSNKRKTRKGKKARAE